MLGYSFVVTKTTMEKYNANRGALGLLRKNSYTIFSDNNIVVLSDLENEVLVEDAANTGVDLRQHLTGDSILIVDIIGDEGYFIDERGDRVNLLATDKIVIKPNNLLWEGDFFHIKL